MKWNTLFQKFNFSLSMWSCFSCSETHGESWEGPLFKALLWKHIHGTFTRKILPAFNLLCHSYIGARWGSTTWLMIRVGINNFSCLGFGLMYNQLIYLPPLIILYKVMYYLKHFPIINFVWLFFHNDYRRCSGLNSKGWCRPCNKISWGSYMVRNWNSFFIFLKRFLTHCVSWMHFKDVIYFYRYLSQCQLDHQLLSMGQFTKYTPTDLTIPVKEEVSSSSIAARHMVSSLNVFAQHCFI